MTATSFIDLGTSSIAASTSSRTITIGANVSIGDNVFVVASCNGSTGDSFTFSDSQGNTWLTDVQVSTTGRSAHGVGHSTITTAMASGSDTITATCSSPRSSWEMCCWIETTPGATLPLAVGAGNPSDGASSGTYTGSTASCGSKTPTSNPDLIICVFSQAANCVSLGTVTNFTRRYDLNVVANECEVYAITNLTTSNAASAPTQTMGASNAGVGSQIIFKYQGNPTTAHLLACAGAGA